MPVQTRSMTKMTKVSVKNTEVPEKIVKKTNITKSSTQNTKLPEKNIAKENISVESHIMTAQENSSTNLFVYKDDTNGIEYITQEHIQMRGISNKFKTLDNITAGGFYLYHELTEIHPRYLKSIPKEVADRKDLFALAPEGYLWVEDDRGTSYFHWDEWYSLKQINYKRGKEFNIYHYRCSH